MKLSKSDPDLQTLVGRINDDELDLQPSFQRGEVWDTKRQQRLIDTILRGWYVPAVHFVIDSEGNELVLDGQQRLTTIRDFFADKLKVDGEMQPYDPEIKALDGLYFSELPDLVRKEVKRFPIQTITLRDYNPQEPNELFFRLNQSYNLTPSEKRNALHGRARDQIKELVSRLESDGLLSRERVGFANGRLAYDDIVARACVSLEIGNMGKHINNNVVEKFYRDEKPFSNSTINRISAAGERLLVQIENCPGGHVRFNKGTLQTWIIYCDWAAIEAELPIELLDDFEQDRARVKRGDFHPSGAEDSPLMELLRIYDDRASYRVTDVASVLARDLAIHLYSVAKFQTAPRKGSEALLFELEQLPSEARQGEFFSFIDAVRWGNPIIGDEVDAQ